MTEKSKEEWLSLSDIEMYYEATVTKMEQNWSQKTRE